MKFIIKLLMTLSLFVFQSCSKEEGVKPQITQSDQESEMIATYKEGIQNANEGDYFYADK